MSLAREKGFAVNAWPITWTCDSFPVVVSRKTQRRHTIDLLNILRGWSRGVWCSLGIIFDRETARAYEIWQRSSQGRAIDRSIERLILTLLDPRPGERILDIGCGSGNHLLVFSKLGLNVSGIDASPYMIQKAKDRLGQCCALKTGNAESLPFEDNVFDMAVFINSLEFFNHPLSALREAGRVANRKILVGIINSLSWNGLLMKAQGLLGNPIFRRARFYNFWQMRSLLQMAYGPVPISWECIKIRPLVNERAMPFAKDFWFQGHSPFRFFLVFSVTLIHRVKTDNLPLKIKLKKTSNPLVGARTFEGLKRGKGDQGDERSLPV